MAEKPNNRGKLSKLKLEKTKIIKKITLIFIFTMQAYWTTIFVPHRVFICMYYMSCITLVDKHMIEKRKNALEWIMLFYESYVIFRDNFVKSF